jgi:hypothetical protein
VKRAPPCRGIPKPALQRRLRCRILVVPMAAVWPEAVGVGGGIKMTAEMGVGDLREAVPAGGGVNRRPLAAARAVISVTDFQASRVLRE